MKTDWKIDRFGNVIIKQEGMDRIIVPPPDPKIAQYWDQSKGILIAYGDPGFDELWRKDNDKKR